MGKNKNKGPKYPFVSVCTPTFNRRPFIPYMIKMYKNQTYPKDRMEWIIIDDGSDPIEDLIIEAKEEIPNIQYFKYDTKMQLGKKRNLMHEKSKGQILVYMDDDDYYPPERVSHSVEKLKANKKALCAGSSEIYVYFKHINKVIQFGPYSPNHATAGTFAFKRELLEEGNHYEDEAALAEEKKFLKDYTVPFVQLDPVKTILVFSHEHNTFDKKKLLDNPNPAVVKESKHTVKDLVQEGEIRDFFQNRLHSVLKNYEPGLPKHKPDVLKQTEEIRKQREKMMKEEQEKMMKNGQMNQPQVMVQGPDGNNRPLSAEEIIHLLKQKDEQIRDKQVSINQLEYKLKTLEESKSKEVVVNNDNEIIALLYKKIELLESKVKENVVSPNNLVINQNTDITSLQEKKIELLEKQVEQLKMPRKSPTIIVEEPNGNRKELDQNQIISLLKSKEDEIKGLHGNMMGAIEYNNKIQNENELLKEKISVLELIKSRSEENKKKEITVLEL